MPPIKLPHWYSFFVQCDNCGFKFTKPVKEASPVPDFTCPHCGTDIKTAIEKWREDARVHYEKIMQTFMQDDIDRQLNRP